MRYLKQAESAERLLEWYNKEPDLMTRACAEAHVTPRRTCPGREDRATAARFGDLGRQAR